MYLLKAEMSTIVTHLPVSLLPPPANIVLECTCPSLWIKTCSNLDTIQHLSLSVSIAFLKHFAHWWHRAHACCSVIGALKEIKISWRVTQPLESNLHFGVTLTSAAMLSAHRLTHFVKHPPVTELRSEHAPRATGCCASPLPTYEW
jgi:hypothetical protein